ncbi:MAG: hypothetical protein GY805_19700 [Chloroflexi bacterium]|nr:hypothetical protein [Chloroflexota bacterium]
MHELTWLTKTMLVQCFHAASLQIPDFAYQSGFCTAMFGAFFARHSEANATLPRPKHKVANKEVENY